MQKIKHAFSTAQTPRSPLSAYRTEPVCTRAQGTRRICNCSGQPYIPYRIGKELHPSPRREGCVREAIHTTPDWGAEEISTSSDKGVNSPPQLLSPKTAQKEIKVFVFPNWWIACSHNPQRSVYTAPTGMFWLITYSYLGEKLISCTWLHRRRGSSEGRSGKDTNPPRTNTLSLGCNSLAISCPTPVLPVLWYIFLGKKSHTLVRDIPLQKQKMKWRKGSPTTFSLFSLCTGCFENYMLSLFDPKGR